MKRSANFADGPSADIIKHAKAIATDVGGASVRREHDLESVIAAR
jgi:hypothetical protein